MGFNQGENETFLVIARRCKRCGGLLTSAQAVSDGFGHACLMKQRREAEARRPLPGQIEFGEDWGEAFGRV